MGIETIHVSINKIYRGLEYRIKYSKSNKRFEAKAELPTTIIAHGKDVQEVIEKMTESINTVKGK